VTVKVGTTVIDPSRYVVNVPAHTIGLFDTVPVGAVVTVQVDHVTTFFPTIAAGVGTFAATFNFGTALGANDSVRIWVNGAQVDFTLNAARTIATFNATNQRGGAAPYVMVEVTRRTIETETSSNQYADASDNDTVNGANSTQPLVIFGGQGKDAIN